MNLIENFLGSIKNHRIIAGVIIFGIIVVAIGNFTTALSSILDFFKRLETPTSQINIEKAGGMVRTAKELRREFHNVINSKKAPFGIEEFSKVLSLISALEHIDEENGNAIYYAGEVKRWTGRKEEGNQDFYHYLEVEKGLPSIYREGDESAEACYNSEKGYCRQRTGWIHHKLANDFFEKGQKEINPNLQLSRYKSALNHAKNALEYFPGGFVGLGQGIPTEVLIINLKKEIEETEKLSVSTAEKSGSTTVWKVEEDIDVKSYNQSGGITAGKIIIGRQPRKITPDVITQLKKLLPGNKDTVINIDAVWGDQEAFQFAEAIKTYLESQGRKVNGVDQVAYSKPVLGQSITDGGTRIIIGGIE